MLAFFILDISYNSVFDSYFNTSQLLLLACSVLLYCFSITLNVFTTKERNSVILLIIAAFVLGLFSISLDPYLNMWDEQFHALVAKNLTKDFFKPTLYPDPVLPYFNGSWTENYVWVHKQPWFLWQMALSIKIFGSSVFAIRFPSLLCFTFATFCTYKIGKNIANHTIGYLAALLFSSNYFFTELISGSTPTDHNDIVFISYVTASLWALTEHFIQPDKKRWILLIGLFSGAALLTKWLPGLLVFGAWFIYIFIEKKKDFYQFKNYKYLLYSLCFASLIFIPWQLYIWHNFPKEASLEYTHNVRHFTEGLDGHSGDNWYYFDALNRTMGRLFILFSVIGIILLHRYVTRTIYITVVSAIILVFGFYTLAHTKMDAFPLICSSLLFISIAALIHSVCFQSKNAMFSKFLLLSISLIGLFINLDPERIQRKHTLWKEDYVDYYDRIRRTEWKNLCALLKDKFKEEKLVIFNCPEVYENISLMYYTNFIGYMSMPKATDIETAHKKGYKIVVIDNGMLPGEVSQNKDIEVVSTPSYRAIKTDTVFIKSENFEYLSMFGEQLVCNDSSQKEVFTIRYFEDGSCYIKNSRGALATIDCDWKGRILFKKKNYSVSERFKIERMPDSTYKIRSADDNTELKIINMGEAICADDREAERENKFVITKAK